MDPVTIAFILAIIVFGVAFFGFINLRRPSHSQKLQEINDSFFELSSSLNSEDQAKLRDVVVQGDMLLSKALQAKFSNTDSCGANLKRANKVFSRAELNRIWEYHKLRNQIVHEGIEVDMRDSQYAYNTFKDASNKLLS